MSSLYEKVLIINHIDSKLLGILGVCDIIKQYALRGEFHAEQSLLFRDKFQHIHKLIKSALSRANANWHFSETSEKWAFGFTGDPGTENETLQLRGTYCRLCGECKERPTQPTNMKACVCTLHDDNINNSLSWESTEVLDWHGHDDINLDQFDGITDIEYGDDDDSDDEW